MADSEARAAAPGPALTPVSPDVFELRLPIPWEDTHVNCFLLPDGEQVDMIDCGMSSRESFGLIAAALREVAGPRARLRRLLVTHIHPDHYGGAGEVRQPDSAHPHLAPPGVAVGDPPGPANAHAGPGGGRALLGQRAPVGP